MLVCVIAARFPMVIVRDGDADQEPAPTLDGP
jgi:hypothetical protein